MEHGGDALNLQRSFTVGNVVANTKSEAHQPAVQASRDNYPQVHRDAGISKFAYSVKLAIILWIHIFTQSLPVISVVVIFMWIFYLPALILPRDSYPVAYEIAYDHIRGHISVFAYFISTGLVLAHLFSLELAKSVVCLVVVPCCLVDVVLHAIPQRDTLWASVCMDLSSFAAPIIGIYMIRNKRRPEGMDAQQETFFQLTKDGTPFALFKGMIGVYVAVVFFFRYFFPFYMEFGFITQATIRLLVFPLIFFLSKAYQTMVVSHLSESLMDRRLIINRLSSLYIKYIGRIALSNISSSGSVSSQYLIVNLLISVADVAVALTFKKRTIIWFRLKGKIRYVFHRCMGFLRLRKVKPFSPIEREADSQAHQQHSQNANNSGGDGQMDLYIKQSANIRRLTLYDEVYSEILVVIITPLLMYFVHSIYPDSPYQTISNIKEAVNQILIQIVFVFIGDIISLGYGIHTELVQYEPKITSVRLRHPSTVVFFSIFCIVYTQYLIGLT